MTDQTTKIFQITIRSKNNFGETEWKDYAYGANKSAAARKAYKIMRSSCIEKPTKVFKINDTMEIWDC